MAAELNRFPLEADRGVDTGSGLLCSRPGVAVSFEPIKVRAGEQLVPLQPDLEYQVAVYSPEPDPQYIYTYSYPPEANLTVFCPDQSVFYWKTGTFVFSEPAYVRIVVRAELSKEGDTLADFFCWERERKHAELNRFKKTLMTDLFNTKNNSVPPILLTDGLADYSNDPMNPQNGKEEFKLELSIQGIVRDPLGLQSGIQITQESFRFFPENDQILICGYFSSSRNLVFPADCLEPEIYGDIIDRDGKLVRSVKGSHEGRFWINRKSPFQLNIKNVSESVDWKEIDSVVLYVMF